MDKLLKKFKSCLYQCNVFHQRFSPKPYKFKHSIFMFYLDLDELEILEREIPIFSINRWNIFSFYPSNHYPKNTGTISVASLKQSITDYLKQQNALTQVEKIKLLTHCRFMGYAFNPVSFYYCMDKDDNPLACIVEVSNTFYEMKLFVIDELTNSVNTSRFTGQSSKNFYVSPFTDLASDFKTSIEVPNERFRIDIDTINNQDNTPEVLAWMIGKQQPLSTLNLITNILKYPLMTVGIIFYIHWHAFILFLKGLQVQKKEWQPELQTQVIQPHYALKQYYDNNL